MNLNKNTAERPEGKLPNKPKCTNLHWNLFISQIISFFMKPFLKWFLWFLNFETDPIKEKKSNSSLIIQDHFYKVFLVKVLILFQNFSEVFLLVYPSCPSNRCCLPPPVTSLISSQALLGWLRSSFGFFCKCLLENPNELFGQSKTKWFVFPPRLESVKGQAMT